MTIESKVYVIGCEKIGVCKIGVSIDVVKRIASIQTGFPFDLQLFKTYSASNAYVLEKSLHDEYKKFLLRGEWFDIAILDTIDEKVELLDGRTIRPFDLDVAYGIAPELFMFGDALLSEFEYLSDGAVQLDGSKECWEIIAEALARIQLSLFSTDEYIKFFADRLFENPPKNLSALINKVKRKYPLDNWKEIANYRQECNQWFMFGGSEYVVKDGKTIICSEL